MPSITKEKYNGQCCGIKYAAYKYSIEFSIRSSS